MAAIQLVFVLMGHTRRGRRRRRRRRRIAKDLSEKSMQTVPLVPRGHTVSLPDDRYTQKPTRPAPARRALYNMFRREEFVLLYLHSLLTASASVSSIFSNVFFQRISTAANRVYHLQNVWLIICVSRGAISLVIKLSVSVSATTQRQR